jgi:pSer/pThr/pTyr-binding forkhead associated (FHA) protein
MPKSFKCMNCSAELSPSMVRCQRCGAVLTALVTAETAPLSAMTEDAPATAIPMPARPDRHARPKWMLSFDLIACGFVLLVGIVLNLPFHWNGEAEDEAHVRETLTATGRRWQDPEEFERDPRPVPYFIVPQASEFHPRRVLDEAPSLLQIAVSGVPQTTAARLPPRYLLLKAGGLLGFTLLTIEWKPNAKEPPLGAATICAPITFAGWLQFVLAALAAFTARVWSLRRHSTRLAQQFESAMKAHVERERSAESHLLQARDFAARSATAEALLALKTALHLNPQYPEALALRAQLKGKPAAAAPDAPADIIYLRIVGTPTAYQSQRGAAVIRVGRQRPKPQSNGDSNDLVIRVPHDQLRSLHISRRHFDVRRIGTTYFVVDLSSTGITINGELASANEPVPVASGDRIVVADCLMVEFSVQPHFLPIAERKPREQTNLPGGTSPVMFEATIGDMVTIK